MPDFNLTCDKFCGLFGVSPVETGKTNLFIQRKNIFLILRTHLHYLGIMREQLREEVTPRRGTANRHKGEKNIEWPTNASLILLSLFSEF